VLSRQADGHDDRCALTPLGSDGEIMHNPHGTHVKTVAAPYRTIEEIGDLLEQIAAQSDFADELARRYALNILDDLAEEMIGRHRPADITVKVQIQIHSERLRASIR
jgi:hypothetical protein